MFLPIRTDRRLERTPWVNYSLIAANTLIFLITRDRLEDPAVRQWILTPHAPRVAQFLGYQFLHHDAWHLLGNMLFLYIFGNAVEDRLGRAAYLMFYLAGGVLAGLGHAMIDSHPVLGASGAVAAVSGAFLALAPMTQVTFFYWFFIIGTFEVSAMVVIVVYFVMDLFHLVGGKGGVAYLAHIAGYGYGFAVGMVLLATGLLPRDAYDMLALWAHRRRREKFKTLTRDGYRPWLHSHDAGKIASDGAAPDPQSIALRSRVSSLHAAGDLSAAAETYVGLLAADAAQVMPQQMQLDLANQLMAMQRYDLAARAYELYLGTYRADPRRAEVELILGLICVRYLDRRQRGRELLTAALPRLHDSHQKTMAREALEEID